MKEQRNENKKKQLKRYHIRLKKKSIPEREKKTGKEKRNYQGHKKVPWTY